MLSLFNLNPSDTLFKLLTHKLIYQTINIDREFGKNNLNFDLNQIIIIADQNLLSQENVTQFLIAKSNFSV